MASLWEADGIEIESGGFLRFLWKMKLDPYLKKALYYKGTSCPCPSALSRISSSHCPSRCPAPTKGRAWTPVCHAAQPCSCLCSSYVLCPSPFPRSPMEPSSTCYLKCPSWPHFISLCLESTERLYCHSSNVYFLDGAGKVWLAKVAVKASALESHRSSWGFMAIRCGVNYMLLGTQTHRGFRENSL